MEHAVPFEAVRPWRTAALVASGVAALELLALIVTAILLLGRPLVAHATKSSAKAAAPKPKAISRAVSTRARTPVLVLNGNGRSGAAHAEATRVRARGYPISFVGNAPAPNDGPTLVMYRPPFQAEAKRLARDLGIRLVAPLDGIRLSTLHGAKLAVLLGR